ncbi:WD40-repeat-containing domain protein [Halteromyces radiatus]|uniref:WD40-repeat-containing domain protein n=1 Tax=Halteromyces radiatus TaxID=101107 RepID=UPI00221F7193|nr:WD40-repeat-containing domain protein [Halteromyces radiatus]KAI8088765.1 WD40-repeat-containing domain protein [Halteromyces radiatus]
MAKEDNKQTSKRFDSGTSGVPSSSSNRQQRITSLDSNASRFGSSHTLVISARDKAIGLANSARDWLQPDWSTPMAHFESLTTVMFSPLAAHPVYRSESMVKAMQVAQQQQRHRASSSSTATSPTSPNTARSELVLHSSSTTYPWPSSSVLLKADIPESTCSLSLFQGFATTYPSLASSKSSSSSPKKSRNRRKKQSIPLDANDLAEKPGSLKKIYAERERKIRESDKLEMQMTSTSNEIRQIDMQIDELINKRKALEAKWAKLETKEQETQLKIEDLTEKILDESEDAQSVDGTTKRLRQYQLEEESDEEYDFGECIMSLRGHDGGILCVDFNRPKGLLVSSSLDDTIRVWDLRNGRSCGRLEGHTNLVRCLQLDDMRLLTGSDDGSIKQWDLSEISSAPTPASRDSFSEFSSAQASPSLSPVVSDDVSSLNDYCVASFDGHQGEVTAMHADQVHLVSGSNDKTMKLWDLETQNCVLTMDVMWASQHSRSTHSSWSLDSLKVNFYEPANDYIGALQFWNFALASGTTDGKIRMWDLRTGQPHRTLPGHKGITLSGAITALQFDEVHLVSGSVDKTIRVWDLRTGSVFDTLTFNGPVSSLRFDSGKVISTTDSNDIDVYNRTSFQHTKLHGHIDSVNTLQHKNNILASGGKDKVVKLWSM